MSAPLNHHRARRLVKRAAPAGKESPNPMKEKEDVQKNNDQHIDQDFPGYPHHPAEEAVISNGSAGAFAGTESTLDNEDSDEDNDDLALNRGTKKNRGSDKY